MRVRGSSCRVVGHQIAHHSIWIIIHYRINFPIGVLANFRVLCARAEVRYAYTNVCWFFFVCFYSTPDGIVCRQRLGDCMRACGVHEIALADNDLDCADGLVCCLMD